MTAKIRSIFLPVLLSLAILSMLTVSLTLGRYTQEAESEGIYSGDLNYIVSNQVEIETVDEFFTAIENGYNNIKIKDEVDNPLVISGGISDVNSDLVIDLNGHEIQRNNREPLLNVTQGVKLTIIDTSEEQTGSFYNPVGSVLRISGGSLTVSAGEFESGPRSGEGIHKSEYYDASSNSTSKGATIKKEYSVDTLYIDENTTIGNASMPVIIPSVTNVDGVNRSVNGNMYFSEGYNSNTYIPADTYLYFTLEDPTVENATIAVEGSAKYYYTYYLNRDTFDYAQTQKPSDSTVQIKVYVYNGVKSAVATTKKPFSAIEMESGNLFVRGGTYRSYFGERDTYCVNASGGYMAIEAGKFYAYGRGVCVQCDYSADVNIEEQYLRVSSGNFYSEAGDTIGVSGGRMVVSDASFIKNAADFALTSNTRNANGSAIRVSGGSLTVSATSEIHFSLYGSGMSGITAEGKNASVSVRNVTMDFYSEKLGIAGQDDPSDAAGILYNTGIYAVGGGSVVCDGNTSFNVIGSYSSGIYSEGGSINLNGDTFRCTVKMATDGEDGKKLSSTAISTVGGSINFNVKEATVSSNGLGITVGGGDICFKHTEQETINITTTRGTAIYVYDGEVSVDENSIVNITSEIDPSCSWVVDTSGGSTGIKDTNVNINNGVYINGGSLVSKGEITVQHTGVENTSSGSGLIDSKIKSYAVRVDGSGAQGSSAQSGASFSATNLNISVNAMADGGGLYVKDGSITLDTAEIDARGFGIAMRGESGDNVTINTTLTLTSRKTTGIYITGGSLTLNGETTVNSTIDAGYTFCEGTDLSKNSYDGVFVENGSLTANSTFTVNFSGLANDQNETFSSMVKSYAVRVDGSGAQGSSAQSGASFSATNLNISVNAMADGGGLYVNQGTITLDTAVIDSQSYGIALRGESDTDFVKITKSLTITSAQTTGIYITGGSLTLNEGSEANITSTISESYRFNQTNATVSYDGVFVEGGSLSANGIFNVTHTGIQNDNQYVSDNGSTLYRNFVIKSFAVRVLSSEQASSSVFLAGGTITNQCGGGLYVGGFESNPASVVFGSETEHTGPSILTQGNQLFERGDYQYSWSSVHPYNNSGYITLLQGADKNWQYKQSKTGGHAVEVNNGTLTIWGGSFEAKHGEGILVKSGNVNIYGGSFLGADAYSANGGGNIAGPAASYSFKIFGGTVNVYDGTFGNINTSGSGAFVMGESEAEMAHANFYGGSIRVNGQAGFSIYEYADITFAPTEDDALIVEGYTCAIAVENSTTAVSIEISGGNFSSIAPSSAGGGRDAIWYSNPNAELVISGGTFSTNIRSGLWFQKNPYYGRVSLSGGTYTGGGGADDAIDGTFNQNSILESGYRIVKDGNTWTVVPN